MSVKGKVVLYLINQTISHKDIWGTGGITPTLFTTTLGGGELSVSRGYFTLGGSRPRLPLERRLGGPYSLSVHYGEEESLASAEMRTSAFQPITRRYTYRAIPTPKYV
jgi:hypothetical protein